MLIGGAKLCQDLLVEVNVPIVQTFMCRLLSSKLMLQVPPFAVVSSRQMDTSVGRYVSQLVMQHLPAPVSQCHKRT